jgi:outer membrane protein OmpA-like peptidoglycan-associated protein
MMQRLHARKPAGASFARPAPSAVHQVVSSPGAPLSTDARAYFEPRFGFDFSRVRVHEDSTAAAAARTMDAAAYTVGQHIAFDSGRFEMHSRRGRRLIAHELAHTVQQSGAPQTGELRIGSPTDASENEADRASSSVLSDGRVAIHSHSPLGVQRQPNQASLPELDPAENASPLVAAAIGSMTLDRFETGKSDIPTMHKAELSRTVKTIASLLRQYPGSTIRIVGHTDAIGKDADNQILGQSRADSVEKALVALGIPVEAIKTESHGSSELRVKTKMENPLNRRVEMRFQPARQFPGVMSSHLSLSERGSTTPPSLFTPNIPSLSPGGFDKVRPPYQPQGAPPGATQALPSNIPWELMDASCISDAYTSHGNRSEIDDATRAIWANSFSRYFPHLSKEKAAWLANQEVCKTAGQNQSRDFPNQQDQSNQDWKNQHPEDKGIPPINLHTWHF